IHAQHNKPSAFETVASELYSVSGGQGEVWQKAMALGRQLDPNNPLFAEASGTAAFAAAAAADTEHATPVAEGDSELPIVPASAAVASAASAKAVESTQAQRETVSFEPESIPKFDLDFNLDEPSRPGPIMPTITTPAPKPAAPKPAPKPVAEPALAAVGAGAP